MNTIDRHATVGELVVEKPALARVFERFGIDYCCGGRKPLDQACSEKGLDVNAVLQSLNAEKPGACGSGRNWAKASLTELADHIEKTHHAYLRRELPKLDDLTTKVASVHRRQHPELESVRKVFEAFRAELEAHMLKEELCLFPMCRELERARTTPQFHCGSINNPIRQMIAEHDSAGHAIDEFRRLTCDYTAPADVCGSFRAMLEGLAAIEKDMHEHVHKENNILFPRATALEAQRIGDPV